jgi:hypothetical protein
MSYKVKSTPGVIELSESEAASLFDKIAWEHLHMSGMSL